MTYRIVKTEFASGRLEYAVQCFKPDLSGGDGAGEWITEGSGFDSIVKADGFIKTKTTEKKDKQIVRTEIIQAPE
jgi:hypothetical protein